MTTEITVAVITIVGILVWSLIVLLDEDKYQ